MRNVVIEDVVRVLRVSAIGTFSFEEATKTHFLSPATIMGQLLYVHSYIKPSPKPFYFLVETRASSETVRTWLTTTSASKRQIWDPNPKLSDLKLCVRFTTEQ